MTADTTSNSTSATPATREASTRLSFCGSNRVDWAGGAFAPLGGLSLAFENVDLLWRSFFLLACMCHFGTGHRRIVQGMAANRGIGNAVCYHDQHQNPQKGYAHHCCCKQNQRCLQTAYAAFATQQPGSCMLRKQQPHISTILQEYQSSWLQAI